MADLDPLTRRPGLDPDERALVVIQACLWPGDHERLRRGLAWCRDLKVDRGRVEEVLLQAILFCGFPRVVNAFGVLNKEWPAAIAPHGGALPAAAQHRAGHDLFTSIYGDNADDVEAMLESYHGELHDFVIDAAYGRILCRPGLEPRVRELLAVAVLAQTDQVPQMIAHGRGALKFGASSVQLREAIYTAIEDESRAERLAGRIR